ncbi:MAG TPA: Flp family type IVb pilin [Stellaceae bacterium]|nr:Flp family type IVb pilin [Stellaceae bacterium]
MMRVLRGLRRRRGATAIEYCLIAGMIALAIVSGASSVGASLNTFFGSVGTKLQSS